MTLPETGVLATWGGEDVTLPFLDGRSTPVSPAAWGPPRHPRHRVLSHGDVHGGRGDPHGTRLDPALAAISVCEACAACDQVLSRHPRE